MTYGYWIKLKEIDSEIVDLELSIKKLLPNKMPYSETLLKPYNPIQNPF